MSYYYLGVFLHKEVHPFLSLQREPVYLPVCVKPTPGVYMSSSSHLALSLVVCSVLFRAQISCSRTSSGGLDSVSQPLFSTLVSATWFGLPLLVLTQTWLPGIMRACGGQVGSLYPLAFLVHRRCWAALYLHHSVSAVICFLHKNRLIVQYTFLLSQ